jgi:hypothetical protein
VTVVVVVVANNSEALPVEPKPNQQQQLIPTAELLQGADGSPLKVLRWTSLEVCFRGRKSVGACRASAFLISNGFSSL